MKKYFVFILLFLFYGSAYGADTKGSALSTFTPVGTDRLIAVDDPGGTPVSGGIIINDLLTIFQPFDANLPTWPTTVDATEVGYLNGVTSGIQTQIDNHAAASDPHPGYMLESNIGTGANNYVQLDINGDLPFAVGATTTNFGGIFSNTTAFDTFQEIVDWIDDNVPALTNIPAESLCVAISDETTDLTTGTAKRTIRAPRAMTVSAVRASVNTAPVGTTLNIDINEGGVSILSTVITIDASEKTSTTAATAAVISDSSIADDAEITFDIDQIGSSTAGKGAKVCIYYNGTI